MRIITYHSENAPAERAWVAYWLVPMKDGKPEEMPPGRDAPPSREGIAPYSFSGDSEATVIAMAQKAWNTSFGKNSALKEAVSTVRTRVRG